MEDNLEQETAGASPVDDSISETQESNSEVGDAAATSPDLESLEAQLAQVTKERDEEKNQHLRTLADFQNFRRRKEEERITDRQYANRELVIGILPVLDNFERALAAAEKSQSYDSLIDGVKLTLRQLNDFLSKNGIKSIEALGQSFDPNLHEAVMRVEDSDQPENTIVEELQRGYTMHDRVLRPSMVKVAHNG